MITVFQFMQRYTSEKNLPLASPDQLRNIGNFISHHFKNFYSEKYPEGVISGAGFTKQIEAGKAVVVAFYPDDFLPVMYERADIFYQQFVSKKEKPVAKPWDASNSNKRKRIPISRNGEADARGKENRHPIYPGNRNASTNRFKR